MVWSRSWIARLRPRRFSVAHREHGGREEWAAAWRRNLWRYWLPGCLLGLQTPVSDLGAAQIITQPFCGITLIARTEVTPRSLSMHIAIIDLGTPGLRFKLTPPSGTRDTVWQSPLQFLRQERAQLAINTHFYLPYLGTDSNANVVGLAVSEGRIYSPFEPQPIGPGFQDQSHAILPFAPAINIDASNHAAIVHRDPAYTDNRHVLEPVTLWTAFCGSAQVIQDGQLSIPTYSGPPFGLTATNGYSDASSWYNVLRGRTVAGLTRDRQTLVLFIVDEFGGSLGMTVAEAADLLIRDYGVQDALNLDGDGSTMMALEDPLTHLGHLLNTSTGGVEGHPVGCNLVVFAPDAGLPSEPGLSIRRLGNDQLHVSWPVPAIELELQQAPSLLPLAWQRCVLAPSLEGGCWHIIFSAAEPAAFFRLAPKLP